MSTSQYTYSPFHTIGAASLLVWDTPANGGLGAWSRLARVADAAVLTTTEQVGQQLVVKGLSQPIARRNKSQRYSLSFRLLENANPAALELLLGGGAVQVRQAAQDIALSECLRLYATDYTELAHPYGVLDGGLPPVTGFSASAAGAGGNIPAGSYYYWAVPYVLDNGVERLGQPARAEQVAVADGQTVHLAWTAPAGYQPDGYKLAYTMTGTLLSPLLVLSVGGQAMAADVLTHQGALPLELDFDASTLAVTSYDGQTTYVAGIDYLADALRGLLKRTPTGAIADGERVVASYSYRRPPCVDTPLGDNVELERYRRVKLVQLAPDDAAARGDLSPATWRETGIEFEFTRVNAALGDLRLAFSEEDFSEGFSVTWDCMFDPSTGRVGTVRSTYSVLGEY